MRERHYTRWEKLKLDHVGNYYLTNLLRAVQSLNALAVGRTGKIEKLILNSGQIQYEVNGKGDVLIWLLKIDDSIEKSDSDQSTGLYRVRREGGTRGRWGISGNVEHKMNFSHRWNNMHYAAVSGKFPTKEEAGRILPEHIGNAYRGAFTEATMERSGNHYSLYWQNGGHKTDSQRDILVSLMQQAIEVKAPVNWLVHGTGAITFKRALEVLATYPSLTRFEAKDELIVRQLRKETSKQGVYFSNPRGAGVTEKELKRLCDTVGLRLVGINRDEYDLLNQDSRLYALNKLLSITSKGVVTGTLGAVGLSDVLKSMDLAVDAATITTAGAFTIGGIVIAKDAGSTLNGYSRSVRKSWGSTFGQGNQRWTA